MFECHVTIEPVEGERLELFKSSAEFWGFKVAALYMQNGEVSRRDSFCTGHNKSFEDLRGAMIGLVRELTHHGYTVYRYKIEAILLDSKYGRDPLGLL